MTEIANYAPPSAPERIGAEPFDPTGGRLVAWAAAAGAAHQLAKALSSTAFCPRAFAGKPDDATAAIILGDELGLSPLTALRSIYVIGGTPAIYARVMVALVMSHGHEVWTVESSDAGVVVAGRRKGSDRTETVTWDLARARKAGYTSNKKYDTDPQAMLYARAAGDVARRIAPDVLAGVPYTAEELEMGATGEGAATPTATVAAKRTVQRKPAKPAPVADEPDLDDAPTEAVEPGPELASPEQMAALAAAARAEVGDDGPVKLAWLIGRAPREIASPAEITSAEATEMLAALTPAGADPSTGEVDALWNGDQS